VDHAIVDDLLRLKVRQHSVYDAGGKGVAARIARALNEYLEKYDRDHCFTAKDICLMHESWLGAIYEWAGKYRQVNISKGNFTFSMARQVPTLMEQLEQSPFHDFTPCLFTDQQEIIHAIAVVHTELVFIHPFREGNGRLARMLAVFMGLQAGLPPLSFGGILGKRKQKYFAAVQAGMDYNYAPIENIFKDVLARTLRED